MDYKIFIVFTIALITLVFSTLAKKSYENYKVYKVVPQTDRQLQHLVELKEDDYDFWTEFFDVGNEVKVMVSPEQEKEFKSFLKSSGLEAGVSIPNVQTLIHQQMRASDIGETQILGSLSWNKYYGLNEIYSWLDELEDMYPNVVTTISIGESYENRPIKGVIIDFKPDVRDDRPLVAMIEGGIHAREWISPAAVTWIIKEFLTSEDPNVRFMAEAFVWHIFPVVNPDGYNYTFTEDRMWRKNRNSENFVGNCTESDMGNGVDLNRNFNFVWMEVGGTSNPCDETYAGPIPSSERETLALSNYVLNLKAKSNLLYYFAFHSYSQMILIPYSHVKDFDVLQVANYADMYEIAIRGAEKLQARYGTPYKVGTSAAILYAVGGASFDWVKGVADIPIVYLFEMRDIGEYGFLLPASQIIPNNEEIMDCLIEMDKTTRQLGYYSGTIEVYRSIMSIVTSLVFLAAFK